MELTTKTARELKELFNKKERLCCAGCGGLQFNLFPTDMPNTDISEAVMMKCSSCEHTRLELATLKAQ